MPNEHSYRPIEIGSGSAGLGVSLAQRMGLDSPRPNLRRHRFGNLSQIGDFYAIESLGRDFEQAQDRQFDAIVFMGGSYDRLHFLPPRNVDWNRRQVPNHLTIRCHQDESCQTRRHGWLFPASYLRTLSRTNALHNSTVVKGSGFDICNIAVDIHREPAGHIQQNWIIDGPLWMHFQKNWSER